MPFSFSSEEEKQIRIDLFTPCNTKEELKQWCHFFLDIELPDTCVDPESNSNMLDMVWTCYSHIVHGPENVDANRYLFYSSRFSGKTLCESIIEVMLLLHARIDITHLAAIERQSRDCQKYIAKFYNLPHLKGILSGDSKKEKVATYYVPKDGGPVLLEAEWKTLTEEEKNEYENVSHAVEVIVATLAATNGKHTALLCLDEIDVMANVDAFEESVNIPTPQPRPDGDEYSPITMLTSTRKFAFGLVSREIAGAEESGLIIRHWNVLDICRACPASRHRPDLPKRDMYVAESLLSAVTPENFEQLTDKQKSKYSKIECFEGCVSNCKILPACKTHLATRQTCNSKFLKTIDFIQNKFKANKLEKALAQLLCRKPSSMGLVYPSLEKEKHLIKPYQAYSLISGEDGNPNMTKAELIAYLQTLGGEWFAGIDWGFTHIFAFVMGIRLGNTFYLTHAYGQEELAPAQKISECERFRYLDPKVWADTEDPAMIKAFRQAGWRMANWTKGSVEAGISTVALQLQPGFDQPPRLYFVRDVDEDPMMELCFLHMREHHYKLGPDGKPTDTVSDENKDFPDAVRYLIHPLFDIKGKITVVATPEPKHVPIGNDGQKVYDINTWAQNKISELTGRGVEPPKTTRPPMTVTEIGSNKSYYAQEEEEEKKKRVGGKRGLVWDFS